MGIALTGDDTDDLLRSRADGEDQIHIFARAGDDVIKLNFAKDIYDYNGDGVVNGHHIYGGAGADEFHFVNVARVIAQDLRMIGRFDDLDLSEDSIWIDGTRIDLADLPGDVTLRDGSTVTLRIVEYTVPNPSGDAPLAPQQFLLIGQNILYALEGARLDATSSFGQEAHYAYWTEDIGVMKDVRFVDQVNYVPAGAYSGVEFDDEIVAGNARLTAGPGNDFIYLNKLGSSEGNLVKSGGGRDVVNTGQGDDVVRAGAGRDLVAGGLDNDILKGGGGRDRIWGGSEDDRLFGNRGNDTLRGGTGDDTVKGGKRDDKLIGEQGQDVLKGQNGSDMLKGGAGADLLKGGRGNDMLKGGRGDDTLDGGGADDLLLGGAGGDLFVFSDGFGQDTIRDFDKRGDADVIDLSQVGAIEDFADLRDTHMRQDGANVVIEDGAGNSITLTGVSLASLGADDFIF